MKKGKVHNKVVFKPYEQNQAWLLPPSLGELIPADHIVRLVSEIIDEMDMTKILHAYEGGGASNYHPKMLLKALVYGYITKVYSSRSLENSLKENICFMWLCGMQQPDHNTINRFRKGQLKNTVKDVFGQVLYYLIECQAVKIEDYHVDGTKIESVANRYTFVWAKNVARYKKGLLEKISLLIEQIEEISEKEEKTATRSEDGTPKIVDSELLKQTINNINEQLSTEMEKSKRLKKKVEKLEKEHLKKLEEYEEKERILGTRNSYSKTDPDASFMRMKDDHMKNGQLKPAYNIQIGTTNQYIVNYTIHQSTTDWPVFIEHMNETDRLLNSIGHPMPSRASGDAGYGSEQNYDYLEEKGISNYLKYPGFFKEQKKSSKTNFFATQNLYYNLKEDYYVCPMGQHLTYRYTIKTKSRIGYKSTAKIYQAQNCKECPLRSKCHRAKTERKIQINTNLKRHRKIARKNLWSLRGIRLRKKRNCDVEPVFGHIKSNRQFNRFKLRSLDGVNIEFGLLAVAHNIKKWWANLQRNKIIKPNPNPPNVQAKANKFPKKQLRLFNFSFLRLRATVNHHGIKHI